MHFDDLFEHIGHIGLYQGTVSVLLCLLSVFGIESVSIIFIGAYMPHWCTVPALANFSHDQQKYISIPIDTQDEDYDVCTRFDLDFDTFSYDELITWNRTEHANTSSVKCDAGWTFDQSEFISTINSRYELVCDRAWLNFFSSSLFMLGVLVASFICGPMGDKFGRKPAMMVFLVIKLLFNVLSTVAPVYWVFALARFFVGMGTTGAYLVAFVLVLELVGPYYRTIFGVGFQLAFSLGFLACVGISYAIRDDRMLQVVLTAPPIVFLAFYWVIPESPRWLIVTRQYDRAEANIRTIAAVNRQSLPSNLRSSLESIDEDPDPDTANVLDLVRTPRIRRWTLIIFAQWFVASLMYYALTLNVGALPGNVFVNAAVSAAVEIPAQFAAIAALNYHVTGRRLTCAISMLLSGVTSFAVIPFIITDNDVGTTWMSMVGKLFVVVAFSGIYVYSTELFPTEVRTTGIGGASFMARISGILAPFVGGPLANVWGPLPYVIFGVCGTLGGLVSFMLPETLGQDLCETVQEAEAFGKPGNIANGDVSQHVAEKTSKDDIQLVQYNNKTLTSDE